MLRFAQTADRVAATTKKLQKTALLSEYFRSVLLEEAAIAAVFFSGRHIKDKGVRLLPEALKRNVRFVIADEAAVLTAIQLNYARFAAHTN